MRDAARAAPAARRPRAGLEPRRGRCSDRAGPRTRAGDTSAAAVVATTSRRPSRRTATPCHRPGVPPLADGRCCDLRDGRETAAAVPRAGRSSRGDRPPLAVHPRAGVSSPSSGVAMRVARADCGCPLAVSAASAAARTEPRRLRRSAARRALLGRREFVRPYEAFTLGYLRHGADCGNRAAAPTSGGTRAAVTPTRWWAMCAAARCELPSAPRTGDSGDLSCRPCLSLRGPRRPTRALAGRGKGEGGTAVDQRSERKATLEEIRTWRGREAVG
jgi:hypothetical protein